MAGVVPLTRRRHPGSSHKPPVLSPGPSSDLLSIGPLSEGTPTEDIVCIISTGVVFQYLDIFSIHKEPLNVLIVAMAVRLSSQSERSVHVTRRLGMRVCLN